MNGVHMNVGTIARIAGTSLGGILLVVMSLQYMYAFSMAIRFTIPLNFLPAI